MLIFNLHSALDTSPAQHNYANVSVIGIVNAVSNYARTFSDFHKMLSVTVSVRTTYAHTSYCSKSFICHSPNRWRTHWIYLFRFVARFHYIFSRGIYDSTHLTCDDGLQLSVRSSFHHRNMIIVLSREDGSPYTKGEFVVWSSLVFTKFTMGGTPGRLPLYQRGVW